jgi:hypothetical protein
MTRRKGAWILGSLLAIGMASAAIAAGFPNILTTLATTQLVRIYYANSPGSTQGYASLATLAAFIGTQEGAGILAGPYPAPTTTGTGTQTFTNSPCTTLTTEDWVPVTLTGKTGTWYIPACQ